MPTDLKPGRELDALVAEKVFGRKVEWVYDEEECRKEPMVFMDRTGDFEVLSHYSTSIACAWEVVETLISTDDWAEFSLDYESNLKWTVAPGSFYHDTAKAVFGETAPHAICLAALKVVEMS